MNPRRLQMAFTLIELLIVIAIVAILLTIGMPGFSGFIANNRITTEASSLVGDIALARSEAVRRGVTVTICAASVARNSTGPFNCSGTNNWSAGRIIFVDSGTIGTFESGITPPDELLRAREALNGVSLNLSANAIQISAAGSSNVAGTATACKTGYFGQDVQVVLSGLVSTSKTTSPCS